MAPKNKQSAELFYKERERIQDLGIDAYAKFACEQWIIPTYTAYMKYIEDAQESIFLPYRTFYNDTYEFIESITDFIKVIPSKGSVKKLVDKHEIGKNDSTNDHRRSGASNQYGNQLRRETVDHLNCQLKEILGYWKFV